MEDLQVVMRTRCCQSVAGREEKGEGETHASSQRLAEKRRWMARSSRLDSSRKYASIIFPIGVVRSTQSVRLSTARSPRRIHKALG